MDSTKLIKDIFYVVSIIFASLLINTEASAWVGPPSNANLIFSGTFDSATIRNYPTWGWIGDIQGGQWTNDIPHSREASYFNYLVSPSKTNLSDYLENYVDTATVPWSQTPTKVEMIRVKQDDPDTSAISRVQYNWFPDASIKDIYIVQYMKIQDDLLQIMPDQGQFMWRSLFEAAEIPLPNAAGQNQYLRAELTINRISDGQGHYPIGWLGNVSYLPSFISVPNGRLFNSSVPIPQGKWFLLTVHYKLDQTNGAFEAGIQICKEGGGFEGDQQQIFSFKNIQTATGNTNISFINFIKAYTGTNVLANGNIWQQIYWTRIYAVY